MMKTPRSAHRLLFGAAAVFALGISPAHAIVASGSASASAVQANVLDGLVTAGPVPHSSVTNDGSDSHSLISLSVAPYLSTKVLNSIAFANVNGTPGSKMAAGSSSIVDFNLSIPSAIVPLSLTGPSSLLGLSFDLLASNSKVTGDAGSFSAIGTSSIVGLMGSGLLSGLGSVTITGAPNQVLLSLDGISVIANRQTSSCTSFDCSISTDALYVDVDKLLTLTLSSSSAHLTAAVPEPSTWIMLAIGLLAIIGLTRRQSVMQTPAALA